MKTATSTAHDRHNTKTAPKKDRIHPRLLDQLLSYDAATGNLFWKARTPDMFSATQCRTAEHICANWNSKNAGREALTADNGHGYLWGRIYGRQYLAHRVVWAMHSGSWPDADIDHMDTNRANNKIENLRPASRSENMRNCRAHKDGASGKKGVTFNKKEGKWMARIMVHGKHHHLGRHLTPEAAHAAYCQAAQALHGEFARVA